ncbi:MAG: 3-oxoadipate enol-lactonase [Deltaproteobacteria bacterium]|jgi:3-oxoadipate enol-lactonase|nr:3-oxoadipate enol-lactonase [Deltaproteobacteria bacterium]
MLIDANGIQINYELSGKEDAPVVVLSHSLGSSMVMWDPQLEVLEPHFRVLRCDMRGHGGSEATDGDYTLDLLADDIIGLLDALNIDRVHFVGLSIGGMIGQCLGLHYPDRFKSLTLCDTSPVLPDEAKPLFQERMDWARTRGMQALVEGTMERWFTPAYRAQTPPAIEPIRRQFLATSVTGFNGCSAAIMGLNYLDRLAEIKLPTLIMVGEDDPGTPVEASETIHRLIQSSKLVVLASAAHLSNIEQAEAFNSHLLNFLQAH